MFSNIKVILTLLTLCLFSKIQAQTNVKDTLFIKYDKRYLIKKTHPYKHYTYYSFKEDVNSEDIFYLIEKRLNQKVRIKNYINLKKLLNSKEIRKGIKGKKVYDDWELAEYFNKKTVFLVKKDSIIELEPNYVIE
ncbi:hypothetical protein [uncultured Formosa sp.]|uniref:hypothetical protein n=1 Tax=uncultured Formosa sp. TaxID=255435 RepID=UPI00262EC001|nr:hypothetical protein [uncultured Formosa sp.]